MSSPANPKAIIHPDRLSQIEAKRRPVIVLSKNNRDHIAQPALIALEAKDTESVPNKKRIREADVSRENVENRVVKQCTESKLAVNILHNEVKKAQPPPPRHAAPLLPPGVKPPTMQSWLTAVNTIVLCEIKSNMIDVSADMIAIAKSKKSTSDTLQKMEMLLTRQLNEFADLQAAMSRAITSKINDVTETKARIIAFSMQ